MLWQYRREIGVTTPRRRATLSEVSRAGGCCRIGWQSRDVFTTLPMWSRFGATIHALDGRCVRRRTFLRSLVIAPVPPGLSISRAIWRAHKATCLPLEDCINARFQPFGKRETRGVLRGP